MKRVIKWSLQAIWRWTFPMRRPFVLRLEAMLARAAAASRHPVHCYVNEETSLLMDHMIRELVRLQGQVERLEHAIDELTPATTGLAVLGDMDGEEPETRSAAG
jgi:hypothetical protein